MAAATLFHIINRESRVANKIWPSKGVIERTEA